MSIRPLKKFIERKAYLMRLNSLLMTTTAGSGHASSCLSAADIVATLFFYAMRFDPKNFNNPNNDRFVLSKGHASPILYAAWKELGMLTQQELMTYRNIDSVLEGHPTLRFAYAEAATGSLGIGLSIGAGMALANELDNRAAHTFVLLGDAEIAEGCVWEAAEIASHYRLGNLVAIVDDNRLGQSTESLHGHHTQRYADKFAAFGWHTIIVDGHNVQELMNAFDKARATENQPIMIIAKTFKGHGVDLIEDKEGWHGKPLTQEQLVVAQKELQHNFPSAAVNHESYEWQPQLPKDAQKIVGCGDARMKEHAFKMGEEVATRKVYGQALTALGAACKQVVSLDAEVKNSTYAEIFEAQFPERFFQCFVAEQNMVSMGVGFDRCGKVPFISTFGAFFARAFDQIRMAAIGTSPLKLVGSHAGVSIGEDGPSQMALEDIALMRSLPNSAVLYPCDAVSTYQLVGAMAQYNTGISYLRTTRMATPVIYENHEQFTIGGCKVLRESGTDVACIVAAGVTVFQALKAYEALQQEGINIAIIDLYSVKPLDATTVQRVGTSSKNRIITVEDHYLNGGLGQAVSYAVRNAGIQVDCLAVTQIPRSGKPAELLALVGIDAAAIVRAVQQMKH